VGPSLIFVFPGELGEGDLDGNHFTYGHIVIDLDTGLVAKFTGLMKSVCDVLS
jgi:hypothetical protein